MKREDFDKLMDADDDEYLAFDRVKNPLHECMDIAAFLLLHKLVPVRRGGDIVSWAGHDEIALDIDVDKLAKAATEDDVITLKRCGVRLSDDCLKMFV